MKRYIKASSNINMDDNIYVYLLKARYDVDDIVVYGNNRDIVIKAGKAVMSSFKDATDLDYRLDAESDKIASKCIENAKKYGCEIAAYWYDSVDFYSNGTNFYFIDDNGVKHLAVLTGITRGDFTI